MSTSATQPFRNFALGVCVAIAPTDPTPVPVGVPKTGFMIESMVTAVAANLAALVAGETPTSEATWNAVCLADFGDGGVAFVAQPQIPPRNVNWAASGKWVHLPRWGSRNTSCARCARARANPPTNGWRCTSWASASFACDPSSRSGAYR